MNVAVDLSWSNDEQQCRLNGYRCSVVLLAGEQIVGVVASWDTPARFHSAVLVQTNVDGSSVLSRTIQTFPARTFAMGELETVARHQMAHAVLCKLCGNLDLPAFRHPDMPPETCSHCGFWLREYGKREGRADCFYAGGEAYAIAPEFPRGRDGRGFGGRPHMVLFDDGRQIYSTNVFTQGKLPKSLLPRMPDTAEFYELSAAQRKQAVELKPCHCLALPFEHVCWPEFLTPRALVRFM